MDKELVKQRLRRVFKDDAFLRLMDGLIDEYPYSGIPIGNRYSPMLANLFLSDMDHKLKEKYKVHYYVRFMDDGCILGYSKPWLHRMRERISQDLADIGLTLKPNYQVFPIESRGIAFLGYRIFPTHILLSKRTKTKLKKVAKTLENWDGEDISVSD